MVVKFLPYIEKNKISFRLIHISYFLLLYTFFYTNFITIDSVFQMSISPKDFVTGLLFFWKNDVYFGYSNAWNTTYLFPVASYFLLFSNIFGLINSQILFYVLLLFLSYILFYGFIREELNGGRNSILLLLPSVFYSTNIFVSINLSGSSVLLLPYVLIPYQLKLVNKLLIRSEFKDILIFSLSFVFASAINPPTLAINLVSIFIYASYKIYTKRDYINKKKLIQTLFLTIIISIGINFYWLISILTYFTSSADYGSILSESLQMQNRSSTYLNVFRFLGLWSFDQGFNNIPYFNYSGFYLNNTVLIFTNFLSLLIILAYSLFSRNKVFIKTIAFIYMVISILMIVGTKEGIFSSAYAFLYDNLPLFSMFRSSYKFMALYILSYCILMSYFLITVKNNYLKNISIVIFIVFIVLSSYPIWGKKVFLDGKQVNAIPEYYYEAADFFKKDESSFKILLLPEQYFGVYTWGKVNANPEILFGKSIAVRQPGSSSEKSNKLVLNLYDYLFLNKYETFEKLSKEIGIKYIVQRNDFDWEYYSKISQSPRKVAETLSRYEKIKEFGSLDVYLLDENHLPIILSNNISFQRINPSKYKIYIKDLSGIQTLNFLESYDIQWKLYLKPVDINEEKKCNVIKNYSQETFRVSECSPVNSFFDGEELRYLYDRYLFDETHTQSFGYSNSWLIDSDYIKNNFDKNYYKENLDGSINVEIILYFKPQSYFYLGILVSLITSIICIFTLILIKLRNIK